MILVKQLVHAPFGRARMQEHVEHGRFIFKNNEQNGNKNEEKDHSKNETSSFARCVMKMLFNFLVFLSVVCSSSNGIKMWWNLLFVNEKPQHAHSKSDKYLLLLFSVLIIMHNIDLLIFFLANSKKTMKAFIKSKMFGAEHQWNWRGRESECSWIIFMRYKCTGRIAQI